MYKIVISSVLILMTLSIIGSKYPAYVDLLNFIILGLTLIVLVWYAYDTHRIADQTVEANLKPIILRGGFIVAWNNIQFNLVGNAIIGQPLEFAILKNIANDINGYIVINKNRHTLLFGNQISQIANISNQPLINYLPHWGWMAPNNQILAIFNPTQFQVTTEDDGIYLEYKDTQGNKYFTREDKNFSSISGKL